MIKNIFKDADRRGRIYLIFIFFIRLTLLIAIGGAVINFRWTVLFVTIFTFVLTFLPDFFEKRYKIDLPIEFEIIVILFIYATLFLGEVHGYYTKFFWWDALIHTGSAVALGFIGFTILYVLYKGDKINARPITIAVFSFCFALAIGAVWEIFEFSMDQLFGYNMQKSGLVDTMWDLIIDSIGALIASVSGYFYLRGGEVFIVGRILRRFEKNNPKIFR